MRRVNLRPSECVLLAYFAYIVILAGLWRLDSSIMALAAVIPFVVGVLAYLETKHGNKATGVLREWLVPALVLLAYQEIRWFERPSVNFALQKKWVVWDRVFLDQWHARAAIESFGRVIPFGLDLSYLFVYAIPPLSLFILYRNHLRVRVDTFLFTLVLGTLFTYALLPYFPSAPPRSVFPGEDLPNMNTGLRRLNLWLLDRYDIRTSVFPSGHVTAAFSAAFGMLLAFPEKKRYGALLLGLATAIAITTVYDRYHYAIDGVAGLMISSAAATLSSAVFARAWRRSPVVAECAEAVHAGS